MRVNSINNVSTVRQVKFRATQPTVASVNSNEDSKKSADNRKMIGATAVGVVAVAGLAIAGRKGLLGERVQKFLGGAKKAAQKTEKDAEKTVAKEANKEVSEGAKADSKKVNAKEVETKTNVAEDKFKVYDIAKKEGSFELQNSSVNEKTKNIIEQGILKTADETTYTAYTKSPKKVLLERNDYEYKENGKHLRKIEYHEDGKNVKSVQEFNPATEKTTKVSKYNNDEKNSIASIDLYSEETGKVVDSKKFEVKEAPKAEVKETPKAEAKEAPKAEAKEAKTENKDNTKK